MNTELKWFNSQYFNTISIQLNKLNNSFKKYDSVIISLLV